MPAERPSRRPVRRVLTRGAPVLVVALLLGLLGCASADLDTSGPSPSAAATPVPGTLGSAPVPTTAGTTPPPTDPTTTTTTAARATASTASTSTARPAGSPTSVRVVALDLVDASRPTVARGRTVAPVRSLPTTVFVPEGPGPYPLVVFAHGYKLGPPSYERVTRAIAAAGYVVAAPSFPLADQARAGANLDRGDLPNEAADVSFVLSALLGSQGATLDVDLVPGAVAVVGHSDGADVALDTAYFPGRADDRVTAVVALNPDAMGAGGGGTGATVPLLLVHGDRDAIVPYSNSQTVFGQVKGPKTFVTLIGADHLPPVQGAAPWSAVQDAATLAFLDANLRGGAADVVAASSSPGVSRVTTG